jgi:single-strand DNA-binding protein
MRGNSVSIKGNVTRDAEVRRTQSGNIVVSWGVAWNQSRKNRETGDYEDVPNFFDVQCWVTEKQLRFLEGSIVKGARCAIIDGHLVYKSWESEGQKRSKVLIAVDDPINGLLVQPPSGTGNRAETGGNQAQTMDYGASVYDDIIPF